MCAGVQAGVSVSEERSVADRGGRAGSRPAEHRRPGCQRGHRHPVGHLHSSQSPAGSHFKSDINSF